MRPDVAPHGDGVALPDVARVEVRLDLDVDHGDKVDVEIDALVLGAERLVLGGAGERLSLKKGDESTELRKSLCTFC